MLLLGSALVLQRAVLDRTRVDLALLLASQSACRAIVLPIGPSGPRLDPARARQAFTRTLDADVPPPLLASLSSGVALASKGTVDAHTGYVFRSQGVMASVRFTDTVLGRTLTETLHVDAEVHHDVL